MRESTHSYETEANHTVSHAAAYVNVASVLDENLLPASEMIPCSLVWFRQDLRVRDHEPLYYACQRNAPVFAIHVVDEHTYGRTPHYDFPKIGPHRSRFLQQCVQDLEHQLHQLGIPLFIGKGKTVLSFIELTEYLTHHGFQLDGIHYAEEIGQEERDIVHTCKQHSILRKWQWHAYRTGDLYDSADVPTSLELPSLFTSFRLQIESQQVTPPAPLAIPTYNHQLTQHHIKPIRALYESLLAGGSLFPNISSSNDTDNVSDPNLMIWQGGSQAGHHRLHHYLFETNFIATYKLTRNGLLSANDSSRLSAWLSQGCISPREVYAALSAYEHTRIRNESTYWLWFELLWREYFRLVHRKWGNRIFNRDGIQLRRKSWRTETAQIEAWLTGHTGYKLVDASMRELQATGYTSNRARQNAASFLTQTWQIDWLVGAEWYESQLIDYDPASNYCNWQYLAGVGNDARQDRRFDVIKQAQQYDPEQQYVRYWLDEQK